MATDSLIGYVSTTLVDPSGGGGTTYLDSDIGFVSTTLVDPSGGGGTTYLDSDIGFVSKTLVDPSGGSSSWTDSNIGFVSVSIGGAANDSAIGFLTKTLKDPASPFIIKDGVPVELKLDIMGPSGPIVVKRWEIMKGGVPVPLKRPPDGDGFIPNVTMPTLLNTGVKAGVPRTPYTGPTVITTPTVIQDKDISVQLTNQSVLILINCFDSAVGASGPQAMIVNTHVNANLYAERCTFKPSTLNFYTNTGQGHDMHFYRCYIENTVDGFSPYANCEFDCCYVYRLAWFFNDSPVHTDGTHNDGVQHHGGAFLHIHGCAFYGYKFNALGTPALDGSADNLWPQIGQIILSQHTAFWVPGYLSSERTLTIDGDGFPVLSTWGGAPLIHHNWIWGGDNGIKFSSNSGSWAGKKIVDIACWIFNNTWMDYPGTKGFTYPYPIRIDTNTWLNGTKYPATTGRGWYETTTPSFDGGNVYGTDSSIPSIWRGKPVGVRVDSIAASVAR